MGRGKWSRDGLRFWCGVVPDNLSSYLAVVEIVASLDFSLSAQNGGFGIRHRKRPALRPAWILCPGGRNRRAMGLLFFFVLCFLAEFDQHAEGGFGMQEGDVGMMGPGAGFLVDEADAVLFRFL